MYGSRLLPQFRRVLHPVQVVDLQEKNPQEVLKNYSEVENLRILVCGGDISNSLHSSALNPTAPLDGC